MSSPDFAEKIAIAGVRSSIYGLLASVYNTLPGSIFLGTVRDTKVRTLVSSWISNICASKQGHDELELGLNTLQRFWESVASVPEDELLVRLGRDRTRLFRGVKPGYGPPPPYESIYRGGRTVMSAVTLQVKNMYADLGYSVPEEYKEIPDYVGIELDFLSYLCAAESEAWTSGDESGARKHLRNEGSFLLDHVKQWVPEFCSEVLTSAKEDFYAGMAHVTKAFISIETEVLKVEVPESNLG